MKNSDELEWWIKIHTDPATGKCGLNLTGEAPAYKGTALSLRNLVTRKDDDKKITTGPFGHEGSISE